VAKKLFPKNGKRERNMTTAIICGGRNFDDVDYFLDIVSPIHEEIGLTRIITGGARGADALGEAWRIEAGLDGKVYPADWTKHGRSAGPIRNQEMLDKEQPDLVIGMPGGSGTKHMIDIAERAGVPTVACRWNYFNSSDVRYGFMSNFYPHEQVDEDGCVWATNEHFYQAMKTNSEKGRSYVMHAPSPGEAKKRGRQVVMREDWEKAKYKVMMQGLRLKFKPGSALSQRLLDTGTDYLVEYAPWGDRVWGVDRNYEGLNWLGRLLMGRRKELNH